jgi:hypothetical protein
MGGRAWLSDGAISGTPRNLLSDQEIAVDAN